MRRREIISFAARRRGGRATAGGARATIATLSLGTFNVCFFSGTSAYIAGCTRPAISGHEPIAANSRPYSIISSASASSVVGIVRPSRCAVWRLMTNSNLDDCTTGRSAGFAPFRMRPQ